jgi:hypothetical protein
MKTLFFILTLILCSCSVTYVEIYEIRKEPVSWCETIYTEPCHWHYRGFDEEWNCVEIPSDTIDLIINDTIIEKIHVGTYTKKEYKIKNNCCDGGKKCN